jgi:hypothetical protein
MRTALLTLIVLSCLGCRSGGIFTRDGEVLLDDMEALAVAMITLTGNLYCPVLYTWETDLDCSLDGFSDSLIHNVDGGRDEREVTWIFADTSVNGTILTGIPTLSKYSEVQGLILEGGVQVDGSSTYTVDMVMDNHDLIYGDYSISGIANDVEFDFELKALRTNEDVNDCRGTDLSVDCD